MSAWKTNRRTRKKFVTKIDDPKWLSKRMDMLLEQNLRNEPGMRNIVPIDEHDGSAWALVGWTSEGPEQNSGNPHDYWNLPDDHVFLDSEGNEMDLAWMGIDQDTGEYTVFGVLQEHPITVKDLKRLPVK